MNCCCTTDALSSGPENHQRGEILPVGSPRLYLAIYLYRKRNSLGQNIWIHGKQ